MPSTEPALPPGVRIRDARPEDAEALLALYRAAYDPAQDPHRTRPLKDTLDDVRQYLRERAVLVAEDAEGRLVATVALRAVLNVRRLAVAPGAKGAGLGGAMLEAAVERARAGGFDFAELGTQDDHPWLAAFYRRHGFEDRCVEVMPDGARWLQMRRRLE